MINRAGLSITALHCATRHSPLARSLLLARRDPLRLRRILRIDHRLAGHRGLGPHRAGVVMRAVEIECAGQLHVELALADQVPVSCGPSKLRSIGAQSELMVCAIGENVVGRSSSGPRSGISTIRAAARPCRRSRPGGDLPQAGFDAVGARPPKPCSTRTPRSAAATVGDDSGIRSSSILAPFWPSAAAILPQTARPLTPGNHNPAHFAWEA